MGKEEFHKTKGKKRMLKKVTTSSAIVLISVCFGTNLIEPQVANAQTLSDGFYRLEDTPAVYRLSGRDACSVTNEQMNIIGGNKVRVIYTNPTEGRNYTGTCTSAILPDGFYRFKNTDAVYRFYGQNVCSVTNKQMQIAVAAGRGRVNSISIDPAGGRSYVGTCPF